MADLGGRRQGLISGRKIFSGVKFLAAYYNVYNINIVKVASDLGEGTSHREAQISKFFLE